jgi:DNA-binding transcriptional ArsR family regulator
VVRAAPSRPQDLMSQPDLDQTLAALADPTRRQIIELLRAEPHRAGVLGEALSMSAPAISRHLRVLRKAGLIEDDEVEGDARVRLYRLKRAPFTALRGWVQEVEAFWVDQLDAFKDFAEKNWKKK